MERKKLVELKTPAESKNLVLVLVNGDYPSVVYDEDDGVRVYTLRCPLQQKAFIKYLRPATVILQFHTLTELQQLLDMQLQKVIVSIEPGLLTLTAESTITFQLIRYLCQKYECDLICAREFDISEVKRIIELDFPIDPTCGESLYIPHSWDSWGKIVLHGRSVQEWAGVIRSEETLAQLDDTRLDDYLEKYVKTVEVEEPVRVPQTMDEFVRAVYEEKIN
ncbi:hypothetical protein KGF57_002851 [Candida theae]|uniref:Uncharacterized protein n=1 Tax=Candida theae TaxID=1198502 RepID=A0AAD5BE96_9ASCO|nr:uncharacterized protein KGF57_002851 [Candida theae]KAI5958043.1 hypothetical protein KGF57_002851 [Candida theae]